MSKKLKRENEKLVGFRMERLRYAALLRLAVATEPKKTIAQLINDALEEKYKLSRKSDKP